MTLDELISRLSEVRAAVGGTAEVDSDGCDCIDAALSVQVQENGRILIARTK